MNEGPVATDLVELPQCLRDDYLTQREIRIQPLNRGFVVNVGCQSFAFIKQEELLDNLKLYLDNPQLMEEKWRKREILS